MENHIFLDDEKILLVTDEDEDRKCNHDGGYDHYKKL